MSDLWVWLDGKVGAAEEARISVLDHGFLYGDSVYETMRTHQGKLLALADHFDRLDESARAIGLGLPWDRKQLSGALETSAATRPRGFEAGLRMVVSRGVGPISLDIDLCREPRLVIYGWPIRPGPHAHAARGIGAAIPRIRRNPVEALDPRIKSGNFLNNILAFREAKAAGAEEAILLSMDGTVTEGTTSNVFWVTNGCVFTPDDRGILRGVTRKHLLVLMEREGIPCKPGRYLPEEMRRAGEIFITSTLRGVLGVVRLDGEPVESGHVGDMTRRLAGLYEREMDAMAAS